MSSKSIGSAGNGVVETRRDGDIGVIVMASPPVNALGQKLREGLSAALSALRDNSSVRAVVLTGSTRAFSGGADITEFGKQRQGPHLKAIISAIEDMPKPVVAAISGVALGGGLELAMGCHYRVAWTGARLGLPEVKLGILPGAGGTQRLPRIVGPAKALKTIVLGEFMSVEEAAADGVVDALMEGAFPDAGIAYARKILAENRPLVRISAREDKLLDARSDPGLIDKLAAPLLKRAKGRAAPRNCVEAVRAAVMLPFDAGIAEEGRLFDELVTGDESRAQRHLFFAEREAQKIPDMPADTQSAPIKRAVVLGAGTMGGGIAMCFANAGIPVTIIDTDETSLARGMDRVASNYSIAIQRGSLSQAEMDKRMALFDRQTDFSAVAKGDIVIEAVFEDMALKKRVFADLDRAARPGTLLASNTSTLDINEIAATTQRPQDVLGMHFFSPANVMKLLEIVRGQKTSFGSLATALAVGRAIGKQNAVVGVCDGFVGNRMLARRSAQCERLLLEGALPRDVDAAVREFGFPMGPFAMSDLAGLDVSWRIRQHRGTKAAIADPLCEAGRFGQKTGAGYYRYEPGSRDPIPDPEVERIILEASAARQISRRVIGRDEITERMVYPMINEAARILSEGIATRPGDVDVIWVHGYGWPVWRGGPMFHGDLVGLPALAGRLSAYAAQTGDETLRPAPLLARLAADGRGFGSLALGEAAKLI